MVSISYLFKANGRTIFLNIHIQSIQTIKIINYKNIKSNIISNKKMHYINKESLLNQFKPYRLLTIKILNNTLSNKKLLNKYHRSYMRYFYIFI